MQERVTIRECHATDDLTPTHFPTMDQTAMGNEISSFLIVGGISANSE